MTTQHNAYDSPLAGVRLYSDKEYAGLSEEQQDKHREHIIRNILLNSKEGITAPQICKFVPYIKTTNTVQKYLDKFVNINVAYKKMFGSAYVYYPNGRLLHQVLEENVGIGKKVYSFIHMKNPDGEFISIQEKKKNDFNALVLSGGIIIDKGAFPLFVEHIKHIQEKLNIGR